MQQLGDYQHEATMAEIILQRDIEIMRLINERETLIARIQELMSKEPKDPIKE